MQQGYVNKDSMLVGNWTSFRVIVDPEGTPDAYEMGNTENCSVEFTRAEEMIYDNALPRNLVRVLTTQAGITITADFNEARRAVLNTLLGYLPSTDNGGYIPIGAGDCGVDNGYVKLELRRPRCPTGVDGIIALEVWRTRGSGNVTMGGGDTTAPMSATFEATEDRAGEFGGSEAASLGRLYIPADPT